MHGYLKTAKAELAVDLSNIADAAQASDDALRDAREVALGHLVESDVIAGEAASLELGLVAFGSLARQEASRLESDLDHAVLAFSTVEVPEHIQEYRHAAKLVCQRTGLKPPGASRIFGGLISGAELVNRIGLDDDTNRTHTQRMLFLEESVPIVGIDQHKATTRAILKRYLVDYRTDGLEKRGVPRFLLNDIVRYWRTIAVDYQAKRWDELNPFADTGSDQDEKPKWGMRYIKLRSSRKLAFCGSLVAVLMPRLYQQEVTEALLGEQFEIPSLARVAHLVDVLDHDDDRDALRRILELADWFAGRFADSDFRDDVNGVQHPRQPGDNPAFNEARTQTDHLQNALERLFQSKHSLAVEADPIPGCEGPLCMRQLTGRYLLF